MTISLGSTVLCSDSARSGDGAPVGPSNIRISDRPGVRLFACIGAERVKPSAVDCRSCSISFDATRIFASVAEATSWCLKGYLSEPTEGALVIDGETILADAAVTARAMAQSGCAVSVSYTIEG